MLILTHQSKFSFKSILCIKRYDNKNMEQQQGNSPQHAQTSQRLREMFVLRSRSSNFGQCRLRQEHHPVGRLNRHRSQYSTSATTIRGQNHKRQQILHLQSGNEQSGHIAGERLARELCAPVGSAHEQQNNETKRPHAQHQSHFVEQRRNSSKIKIYLFRNRSLLLSLYSLIINVQIYIYIVFVGELGSHDSIVVDRTTAMYINDRDTYGRRLVAVRQ